MVILGAPEPGYVPTHAELAFLRKSYNDCTAFLAICAGVAVALEAGILESKTATGPRLLLNHVNSITQLLIGLRSVGLETASSRPAGRLLTALISWRPLVDKC